MRDDGLISLLMKLFVSHQPAIKCCQRYIISLIDSVSNLRLPGARWVHGRSAVDGYTPRLVVRFIARRFYHTLSRTIRSSIEPSRYRARTKGLVEWVSAYWHPFLRLGVNTLPVKNRHDWRLMPRNSTRNSCRALQSIDADSDTVSMWIAEYRLTHSDRELVRRGWLNDRIVDAVNR